MSPREPARLLPILEPTMDRDCRLSIVIPLYNEEESVSPLVEAVEAALTDVKGWELVLVDDGSRDATADRASQLAQRDDRIHLLKLVRNYGQTTAMQAGFDHASGSVIVSLDGDLQNDPRDIPRLLEKLEEGYDLVAGYRKNRQDKLLTRKVPSWVANKIIGWITGVPIRDNGCSLKAYRRETLERLSLYSDLHRFIPAVAASTAAARIAEIPVRHHPRRLGESKYGLSRVWKVLADLLTVKMIRSFRDRPLRMFTVPAVSSLLLGTLFLVLGVTAATPRAPAQSMSLVYPTVAIVLFGVAGFLVLLGLIGEVVIGEQMSGASTRGPLMHEVET